MYLLIDNYDSFTYNISNLVQMLGKEVEIIKNDEVNLQELLARAYEGIILSPGPSRPENAGDLIEVIQIAHPHLPILGICLGHQAIGHYFGGRVQRAEKIMHGKLETIKHVEDALFKAVDSDFTAVRYHSLVVAGENLPDCLIPIAIATSDNEIMAVKHRDYPIYGLQFHPESYMTHEGVKIMENFFKIADERGVRHA